MTRFSFENTDKQLASALRKKGSLVVLALVTRIEYWMLKLQQRVQRKLSGEVLQQRSGRLLGSVNVDPVENDNGKISGGVSSSGGPAWYGRVHEYGGTREYPIVPVNKQALAFFPSGAVGTATLNSGRVIGPKQIFAEMHAGKAAGFSHFAQAGGIVVKAVLHPPLPKRPFMKPSQDEITPPMNDDLQNTVAGVLKA